MASTLLGSTSMPTPALSAAECDREAAFGERDGQRQAHVAQADHCDGGAVIVNFGEKLGLRGGAVEPEVGLGTFPGDKRHPTTNISSALRLSIWWKIG